MATARKTPASTPLAKKVAPPTKAPLSRATPKPAAKPAPATAVKTAVAKAAKTVVTTKAAAPTAAAKTAKPVKVAKPAKSVRDDKARKPKLVRDSFTIPKPEYAAIDELKSRAAKLGQPAKKSEVLRAGIKLLASLSDTALVAALAQVPALKTGRPGKE